MGFYFLLFYRPTVHRCTIVQLGCECYVLYIFTSCTYNILCTAKMLYKWLALFPGHPRFYLPFAFTIIHGSWGLHLHSGFYAPINVMPYTIDLYLLNKYGWKRLPLYLRILKYNNVLHTYCIVTLYMCQIPVLPAFTRSLVYVHVYNTRLPGYSTPGFFLLNLGVTWEQG